MQDMVLGSGQQLALTRQFSGVEFYSLSKWSLQGTQSVPAMAWSKAHTWLSESCGGDNEEFLTQGLLR